MDGVELDHVQQPVRASRNPGISFMCGTLSVNGNCCSLLALYWDNGKENGNYYDMRHLVLQLNASRGADMECGRGRCWELRGKEKS